MYYLRSKLRIKKSKSTDQILSQCMHDTANQSNHRQDGGQKRSQVTIVKRMANISVVLIFFVSTTLWPKETAQNKKRCKPEYVKGNKLTLETLLSHRLFLFLDCLNNIIDFGFTLKYNTTLPVSLINCISQLSKQKQGKTKSSIQGIKRFWQCQSRNWGN